MYTMGEGKYKDEVSSQIIITESGKVRIPEREARGDVLESLVNDWFGELGLENEVIYHSEGRNGRIDHNWKTMNAEIECKNLNPNKNYTWSHLVIKSEIVDRSHARFKLLIVTDEKWGKTGKQYLESEGWRIIETGGVDSEEQIKLAKERFVDGILDFIIAHRKMELDGSLGYGGQD